MSISLDYLVSVRGSVLSAGSGTNTICGLMLSRNPALAVGAVTTFTSAAAVGKMLGYDSQEYLSASVYFTGFTNSALKPSKLYASRVAIEAQGAELIGGGLSITLAQLQALSGSLTISVDGTAQTATIAFSTATSFSAAAALIQAAITGVTVSYNSGTGGFIVTSDTTTSASQVSYASGDLAASLALTEASGAVVSQAVPTPNIASQMDALWSLKGDWGPFFCAFDPIAAFLDLAAWTSGQSGDVMACLHDTNAVANGTTGEITIGSETVTIGGQVIQIGTTNMASQIATLGYGGTACVYQDPLLAAGLASISMCVDFTKTNGRTNAAFRQFSGVSPSVTDKDTATALEDGGYNFYGEFAGDGSTYYGTYPGCISGDFAWIDSYINQMWMRRNFQLSLVSMLFSVGQIPYNTEGQGYIEAALQPKIDASLSFGAIRAGVALSDTQAAEITAAASQQAAQAVQTYGYYLYVDMVDVDAATRAARQTPPITLWYTDGQSVQRLAMTSIEVQ